MQTIRVPKHATALANELSSILFGENIAELSKIRLLGVALAVAYATKNSLISNELAKYAREYSFLPTMSLAKKAAAMAETNTRSEEKYSFIIDRKSAASVRSACGDSGRKSVPLHSFETPSAVVEEFSVELNSSENSQCLSQECNQNEDSDFDTNIFVVAATYVIDRETCLKIGTELISAGIIDRNILMTIINISVLVASISAQLEHVDEQAYKVLLIDDDARITRRVKLSLESKTNFVVKVENNSFKTLQVAREFSPDIIVLDLYMPGKNGGEVLASLKADPELRDTKVLFLTALLTKEEAGEHGRIIRDILYLAKTAEDEVLIDAIRDQLYFSALRAA